MIGALAFMAISDIPDVLEKLREHTENVNEMQQHLDYFEDIYIGKVR